MSALDEIVRLENEIHDMVKAIDEARIKIRQTDDELRRHTLTIDGAQAKIKLHTGNVKHMRDIADHVDIKEFAETKRHLQNSHDTLVEARAMTGDCERRRVRYESVIERATKRMERARRDLSQYGQVRQFTGKEAT